VWTIIKNFAVGKKEIAKVFDFIVKDYPIVTLIILFAVWMLLKNHIFATPGELKDIKKKIIEELTTKKVFVTHEELNQAEKKLTKEFEEKYLMLRVWEEFKTGIEKQFANIFKRFDESAEQSKELFNGINEIKNYLMKKK